MRTRDTVWQQLATRGDFSMETKAVINNVEYETISAPNLRGGLLAGDSLAVGNCIATTLTFTVMTTDEIPKAAQVVIKSRLSDGQENGLRSQWMDMGTFWINQRTKNDDLIDLECYDAMMKGNQQYSDNSQTLNWPKPMSTVVTRIAQQMGVTIDTRTRIKTGTDYQCTKPGDKDTLLDILRWIGEVHGGNWIITPENKLRLVPLVTPPPETFNVIDYSYNRIQTDDGYNLVWNIENGTYVWPTSQELTNEYGFEPYLLNVPVVIGEITTASRYTISKITMTVTEAENETTAYVAGTDTGYNLIIEQNPYATQAICNDLYSQLNGLEYAPYSITNACFDPCIEYGDWVIVADKVISVLYNMEQRLNTNYRANISAPGKDEVEEEYPFQTPTQKMQREITALNADGAVIKSEISQMQDSITLTIEELDDKADKAQIRTQFALDSTSVTIQTGEIAFTSDSISIDSQYFTLTADGTLTCTGATINGSLRTVYDVGYGTITVTDLRDGMLTLVAAPYSQSIHNNYDNIYSASNRAQIEFDLNASPGYNPGSQDKDSGITAYNGTTLRLTSTSYNGTSGSGTYSSNIWLASTYYSGYGYSSWVAIDADYFQAYGKRIVISADDVIIGGNLWAQTVQSGYQGITNDYWTFQWGSDWTQLKPLHLTFNSGLCVGAHY